jgi:predicted phosphatase
MVMKKPNDMVVMFDVDETLVLWDFSQEDAKDAIVFDNFGVSTLLLPHFKHIDQIKRHAARGHMVYVWSAGGVDWATEVVKTLGLEPYVHHIMCKPQWYYDDLRSDEFLPEINRVYYNPKSKLEETVSYVNEEEYEGDN